LIFGVQMFRLSSEIENCGSGPVIMPTAVYGGLLDSYCHVDGSFV
jgi:hypothetical protein